MNINMDALFEYKWESEVDSDGFIMYSVMCYDAPGELILKASCVTSDKMKVEDFCDLLNRNSVSSTHFLDVLEDYFYC